MQKVRFEDHVFEVPETPGELTLDQYLQIYSAFEEKEDDDYDVIDELKLISIAANIPLETLGGMPRSAVNHLVEICGRSIAINEISSKGFTQSPTKEKCSFVAGSGETFSFQPNYIFARLGDIRRMEDFMSQHKLNMFKRFYYVLANIAFQEGEVFDPTMTNIKAQKMLSAKMGEIGGAMLFFLETRNSLLSQNNKAKAVPDEDDGRPKVKKKATPRSVLRDKWGWYHVIMQRLIGEGKLCRTLEEAEELDMMTVFRYLVYLNEVDEVEKFEYEKAKMQRQNSK